MANFFDAESHCGAPPPQQKAAREDGLSSPVTDFGEHQGKKVETPQPVAVDGCGDVAYATYACPKIYRSFW